jgi:hypothetical protein
LIINISDVGGGAMLNALADTLGGGTIEILTADGVLLAVLQLSTPAAGPAADGELKFNEIADDDAARAEGAARSARIVGPDGAEIFSCDVGGYNSNAVIKLAPDFISVGERVRINEFKLKIP